MAEMERELADLKKDVAALGTAAKVAAGVADNASRRERRLYALAGIVLTSLNVAVAIAGASIH